MASSDIDVRMYLAQLRTKLPHVPPVPVKKIRALHRRGDLGGIVRLIRSTMNVNVNLTLHWTERASSHNTPAWVMLPDKMPYYGTPAFRELRIDMYILKSFAQRSTWAQFAITVAHELSHIVLDSIEHPLRREEKAVDLTAMLLGFSDVYGSAAHTTQQFGNMIRTSQLGYLARSEVSAAWKELAPRHLRVRRAALGYAKASAGLLIFLGIWGAILGSSKWRAYGTAADEAREWAQRVPVRYDDHMALTEVSSWLWHVTRVFSVDPPPGPTFDFARFEQDLRRNVCSAKGANIKRGVAYYYEYRRLSGQRIASFKIDDCP